MNHDLCDDCQATWDAMLDRLDAHVGEMAGELEDWQVVAALIATAGGFARQHGISAEEILSEFRETLIGEYGITISGVAIETTVRKYLHPEGKA